MELEWENPTGSLKDRMAQAVITRAEQDGRLKPGDTVVDYTGGSTGASLALVCVAKNYRLHIVTSDAFSQEKLDQDRRREGNGATPRAAGGPFRRDVVRRQTWSLPFKLVNGSSQGPRWSHSWPIPA